MALPLPRHADSAAADLAALHTGLNDATLLIEGARTHAHGISTGAVAVFRAFQRAQPGVDRSAPRAAAALRPNAALLEIICLFKASPQLILCHLARAAGFLAALGSVV